MIVLLFAFKGSNCNNEMLDYVFLFKGEAKKINNKIVESSPYMIVQNGSGFDSYIVLNILPEWRSVVNLIENGGGIVSFKIFYRYVDEKKKMPQYVHFRCGKLHFRSSSRETDNLSKLQLSLLKQELEYKEIYEATRETRENEWLPYVKHDVFSTAFYHARYTMDTKINWI